MPVTQDTVLAPLICRAKQTGFWCQLPDPFWMPAVPRQYFSLMTSERTLTLWMTPIIQRVLAHSIPPNPIITPMIPMDGIPQPLLSTQ